MSDKSKKRRQRIAEEHAAIAASIGPDWKWSNFWGGFIREKHGAKNAAADQPKSKSIVSIKAILSQHRAAIAANPGESGKQSDIKSGFVYIVSNPAWPDHVKIGCAIDYEDRLNSYQTGSPLRDYRLEYVQYFDDRKAAEAECHKIMADGNVAGEWFKISVNNAIEKIYAVKKSMQPSSRGATASCNLAASS